MSLAQPFHQIIDQQLASWQDADARESPTLRICVEAAVRECLAVRDKNWEDGNATLRRERDIAKEQLAVKDPLLPFGYVTESWLEERNKLASTIVDLRFAADGFKAIAAKEAGRLDWLCEYITQNGANGFKKLAWSVYSEDGERLNHLNKVREDDVEDLKFDRPAIDDAMAKDQPCPTA